MGKHMIGLIVLALLVVGSTTAFAGSYVSVTAEADPQCASNAAGSTATIVATTTDNANLGSYRDLPIQHSVKVKYWLIGYTGALTDAQEAAMKATGWADYTTNRMRYPGGPKDSCRVTANSGTFSKTFSTKGWPEGEYSIGVQIYWVEVKVTDKILPGLKEYEEVSAVPTLKIDSTVPVVTGITAPAVFKDDTLFVDGKPFFFIGTDGVPTTLEDYKAHHFNTVYYWNWRKTVEIAPEADRLGLFVFPFVHTKQNGAVEECRKAVNALKGMHNILAFSVGDDLTLALVSRCKALVEVVRSEFPRLPIAYTSVQESQDAYKDVADMFSTYMYVLNRELDGRTWTYLDWLEEHFKSLSENQYRWTWVQSHSQEWYTIEFFNGAEGKRSPSTYPDGEMIRWGAYQAIAAGCKGILYYTSPYFRDDWFGKDRWAEVGILNAEIETLGEYLAVASRGPEVSCDRKDVLVRSRSFPEGTIVIAVKNGPTYYHQLDEALVPRARIQVEGSFSPKTGAYLVGFPAVRQLPVGVSDKGLSIELTDLEIAAPIFISNNSEIVADIKQRIDLLRPEIAGRMLTAAEGKLEKVQNVISELQQFGEKVPETRSVLSKAESLIDMAREAKDPSETINLAAEARRRLRGLQERIWVFFRGDPKRNKDGRMIDFYAIPQVYKKAKLLKEAGEQPNLLANPSFEEGNEWPVHWYRQKRVQGKYDERGFAEWSTKTPPDR